MPKTHRILIVDDEAEIRAGVIRWLVASGFEALCAHDGETGIGAAEADPPDAIILDMLLPNKNGLQVMAELRSRPRTLSIPIIMLSASLRDEQQALDAGARFFVRKPYDGKTLVSAVKAAIRQDETSSGANQE